MSAAQSVTSKNEGAELQRAAIRESVTSGSVLTLPYVTMNVAAAFIAGFGLMENSPAVIIGAMLIAMLFGPIVGISMALAEADLRLLGRAIAAEAVGAVCVLAVGLLIGVSTHHLVIGSEILNRTAPGLLDLLIALVGGLAGGFTFLSPSLSSVIVGVAIATALVPPMTTCGILLARGLPEAAAGAFLPFLANFSAIAFGAMIVFLAAGYHPAATDKARKVLVPRLICVVLVLGLAVHLFGTLIRTSAQVILQSNIQKVLGLETEKVPGARLAQVKLLQKQGKTIAWVVIRTPKPFTPEEVAHLNEAVDNAAGRDIGLTVRSVLTAETNRYENVYEPEVLPVAELFMQDSSPDLDEVRAILADIRKDDQSAGNVIDRMRSMLKRKDLDERHVDRRTRGRSRSPGTFRRWDAAHKLELIAAENLPPVFGHFRGACSDLPQRAVDAHLCPLL